MRFVRRAEWGAPVASPAAYIGSTLGVKVHYLGTEYSSRAHGRCGEYVRSIRASHLANRAEGYIDIAYNALVCEHGYVYEGRGLHKRTGANGTAALNSRHYAVCALLGSSGLTQPGDDMLHGIRDAIEWLRRDGDAGDEIKGHRDGYATVCPGDPLYAWVRKGAPRPGASSGGASGGSYTVEPGDTLGGIAERHGVAADDLARANSIADPNLIYPGQRLTIPQEDGMTFGKSDLATMVKTDHVVKSPDHLDSEVSNKFWTLESYFYETYRRAREARDEARAVRKAVQELAAQGAARDAVLARLVEGGGLDAAEIRHIAEAGATAALDRLAIALAAHEED